LFSHFGILRSNNFFFNTAGYVFSKPVYVFSKPGYVFSKPGYIFSKPGNVFSSSFEPVGLWFDVSVSFARKMWKPRCLGAPKSPKLELGLRLKNLRLQFLQSAYSDPRYILKETLGLAWIGEWPPQACSIASASRLHGSCWLFCGAENPTSVFACGPMSSGFTPDLHLIYTCILPMVEWASEQPSLMLSLMMLSQLIQPSPRQSSLTSEDCPYKIMEWLEW
jgi:hypothetical protein